MHIPIKENKRTILIEHLNQKTISKFYEFKNHMVESMSDCDLDCNCCNKTKGCLEILEYEGGHYTDCIDICFACSNKVYNYMIKAKKPTIKLV